MLIVVRPATWCPRGTVIAVADEHTACRLSRCSLPIQRDNFEEGHFTCRTSEQGRCGDRHVLPQRHGPAPLPSAVTRQGEMVRAASGWSRTTSAVPGTRSPGGRIGHIQAGDPPGGGCHLLALEGVLQRDSATPHERVGDGPDAVAGGQRDQLEPGLLRRRHGGACGHPVVPRHQQDQWQLRQSSRVERRTIAPAPAPAPPPRDRGAVVDAERSPRRLAGSLTRTREHVGTQWAAPG